MFIALDKNKERITIENVDKNSEYYCPICGERLIIRAIDSVAVKTHFAHKRGYKCPDDFSHDMSEWHLNWQKQFPEQYREVIIEKNGIKHRADICINNTVIEFQHSPITSEEISKRNDFYLSCGHNVVWVFDADDQIKNWLDGSIDPMQCESGDLCWKRAKQQFTKKMSPSVKVFLNYKSFVSNKLYQNQKFDIMILLTDLQPKYFSFYKTYPCYIQPSNFLKEYGVNNNDETLTITEILNKTQLEKQMEIKKRNEIYRRYYNIKPNTPRYPRF